MADMTTSQARNAFKEAVQKASDGERIILRRHRKIVAAIVSAEDLKLLQLIEDLHDRRAAREAKEEAEREGTMPMETLFGELGL